MAISDNPAPSWYKEARAASHVTSTLAGLTSWLSELTTPIDKVRFHPLSCVLSNPESHPQIIPGWFFGGQVNKHVTDR